MVLVERDVARLGFDQFQTQALAALGLGPAASIRVVARDERRQRGKGLDQEPQPMADQPPYRPGVDRNTVLLWAAPGLLLVLGAVGLLFHFRQRPSAQASDLTDAEQAEIARLLGKPRD